jgi:hypothetical protein
MQATIRMSSALPTDSSLPWAIPSELATTALSTHWRTSLGVYRPRVENNGDDEEGGIRYTSRLTSWKVE